jgi:3-methyl-2-oxobutanoate hydroxymethyltransferase
MMGQTRVRVPDLERMKRRGEKITMLTAYDATMARLLDRAGLDAILVGDSLGMVVQGDEHTLGVTMDAMVHHARAVSRGTTRALVVADMPFLSYQINSDEAVRNAGRLIQEGSAAAVKLEGGVAVVGIVRRIAEAGIPVFGHLGVMPQSVHQMGGYRRRGDSPEERDTMMADAAALERAGASAIVLESIPHDLARTITARLRIPTIGIGAGPDCDGQVLVGYDMLGLVDRVPPFVKQYANLGDAVVKAAAEYVDDVRSGRYAASPVPAGTASDT